MSVCPQHHEMAVHRDRLGYWFCPRCLDALFEWEQWVRDNLVPEENKDQMWAKNKEIAEEHKRRAEEFWDWKKKRGIEG